MPLSSYRLNASKEQIVEGENQPMSCTDEIFDYDAALGHCQGDVELLHELIEIHLSEGPQLAAQLEEALGRHDARTLLRSAHQLKGSMGLLSAQRALNVACRLETSARAEGMGGAERLMSELYRELASLRLALIGTLSQPTFAVSQSDARDRPSTSPAT